MNTSKNDEHNVNYATLVVVAALTKFY